jgi:hypothetical protein
MSLLDSYLPNFQVSFPPPQKPDTEPYRKPVQSSSQPAGSPHHLLLDEAGVAKQRQVLTVVPGTLAIIVLSLTTGAAGWGWDGA